MNPQQERKERGIQLWFAIQQNEQTKIQLTFKITLRLTQVGELSIYTLLSTSNIEIKQKVYICRKTRHPPLPTARLPRQSWAKRICIRAGRQSTKGGRVHCGPSSQSAKTIATMLPSSGLWPTHTAKPRTPHLLSDSLLRKRTSPGQANWEGEFKLFLWHHRLTRHCYRT